MASVLKFDQWQSTAGVAKQTIVQVVSSTITGMQDISSVSYVDVTGMTATITPTSASSRIFISVAMYYSNAFYPSFLVDRNGSTVVRGDASGPGERSSFAGNDMGPSGYNNYRPMPLTFNYVDSPASTSALTYKLRCSSGRTAANSIRINGAYTIGDGNQMITTSTITLMEIAG